MLYDSLFSKMSREYGRDYRPGAYRLVYGAAALAIDIANEQVSILDISSVLIGTLISNYDEMAIDILSFYGIRDFEDIGKIVGRLEEDGFLDSKAIDSRQGSNAFGSLKDFFRN